MGYCIEKEEGQIKIKKENMIKALKTLSDYFTNGGQLRWVNGFDLDEVDFDEPIEEYNDIIAEMWDDLRYGYTLTEDYYIIEDFYGEKLGEDDKLFNMIAPYCEDGYIQFCGEDGEHFRYIIKDGKFEEKYADISW